MFYVQGPPYYVNQPPGLTNSDQPLLATITSCGHSPKLCQVLPGCLITPGCVARNFLVSHPVTLSLTEFSTMIHRTCKYSCIAYKYASYRPGPGLGVGDCTLSLLPELKNLIPNPSQTLFFLRKKKKQGKARDGLALL